MFSACICLEIVDLIVAIYTGVTIIIPAGAIPECVQQEVYFKVCQDNSILPPLDKDKGILMFSCLSCQIRGVVYLGENAQNVQGVSGVIDSISRIFTPMSHTGVPYF